MFRTREVPTQIFGNVRFPVLRIKTNSTLQCWCGLANYVLKTSRLNWKLKISNTADNTVTPRPTRDIFYLRTKFSDSRFSRSGYMTAGIEIENGSCDPDHAVLGVVCHPKVRTWYSIPVCKIWRF